METTIEPRADSAAADYKVVSKGLISVCMFCFPKQTIFDRYPDLKNYYEVSHGICKQHHAQMKAELEAMKL